MTALEKEFIRQSSADLSSVLLCIQEHQAEIFPNNSLKQVFRTLHSIKGTAQAFGFSAAGNLAHALENLVCIAKGNTLFIPDFKSVLCEGISLLIESFERENFQIPPSFAAQIEHLKLNAKPSGLTENFLGEIPETILGQLSAQEKSNLNSVLRQGKNLFVLEIGFALPVFAAEFRKFREVLGEKGEIIAALACPKFAADRKIGFQIVFAANKTVENVNENTPAEIIFERRGNLPNSLPGVLAKIVGHGKNSAKMLGKDVEFIVLADEFKTSDANLKLIFDILLQLVRNAVSHAFVKQGRIEIDLKASGNSVILSVADNGKGLDKEAIKAKAAEKKLPTSSADLTESEIFGLIFLPEFSTAAVLTEISGRGIGLDVVKNLTENAGGKINVKSTENQGTTFEITLPNVA